MVVLYAFRTFFLSFLTRPSFFSVAIGVVVFVLWIILIPENPTQSTLFFDNLTTAPLMVAIPWLLIRVFGASVIIPIAEELTFRGYVQPHLQRWLEEGKLKSISAIASLVFTALLFGYVHSDILAGSLAGLFFGLAYLHRRQLIDAVVAHAVTNALLAVYVISFGYWSYW
jgi:CAAX prenyl protease-like protein